MVNFTDGELLQDQPQPQEIQSLFNRIAPIYDNLNDWLSLGQHHVWKKMALAWADPRPGEQWLDLCCGTGDLTMLLAKRLAAGSRRDQGGAESRVFGVDFAKDLLDQGQRRSQEILTKATAALITWQQGDALNLEFAAAALDGVTIAYGLRNVVDIPRCLGELHRVLKPNGKAVILDFHRPTDDLMAAFQRLYLGKIVVPLAERFGCPAEYAYIQGSLDRFPIGPEQVRLSVAAGFSQATHYPIAGGMMGVLVLVK